MMETLIQGEFLGRRVASAAGLKSWNRTSFTLVSGENSAGPARPPELLSKKQESLGRIPD